MNFSFASAPNTPYMPQADGRSVLGSGVSSNSGMVGGVAGLSASSAAAAIHAAATTTHGSGSSGGGGGFVGATRATDPLNDIGSPVSLQYLQYAMSSPFFISEAVPAGLGVMGSPAASAIGLGPKHLQAPGAPALIVTGSASPTSSSAAVAALGGVAKLVLSPAIDDTLPGFFHPAEVFTTPKIQHLDVGSQKTPDLALFDDSEAIISALSPRTQTAQAGLSLLAASATYARSPAASSSHLFGSLGHQQGGYAHAQQQQREQQRQGQLGSPFLNADGVDATLMSQPQNSLAQHLSPQLTDHNYHQHHHPYFRAQQSQQSQQTQHYQHQQHYGYRPDGAHGPQQFGGLSAGQLGGGGSSSSSQVLGATGRLMHKRSLLRQSSGLTSASFHNDLVPQPTESFFAPLDEVCSDSDALASSAAAAAAARGMAQPLHHRQSAGAAPRVASQFSPVMGHAPPGSPPALLQRFQPPQPQPQPQSQHAGAYAQRGAWVPQYPAPPQRQHALAYPVAPAHRPQVLSAPATNGGHGNSNSSSSIPGVVFSQMPTLSSSSSAAAVARPGAPGKGSMPPPPLPHISGGYAHRGSSLPNDVEDDDEEEEEEDDDDEDRIRRQF
ncbi:hypothetical protein GGF44_003885, partial [Coemansia sp. RSA 1694]